MKNVKRLIASAKRLFLFSLLVAAGSRCTQPTVERQAATGPCRIRQVDATETISANSGGVVPNETVDKTIYEYDEAGRIRHTLLQRRQTQQTKVINDYGVDQAYTYDATGFLITLVEKTRWKTEWEEGTYEQRTTYTYSDGRLTQSANQYSGYPKGVVSQLTSSFTYDATGGLSRLTEVTTYPTLPDSLKEKYRYGYSSVTTYQNGRPVDFTQKLDNVESRPYTFQNGLATTYTQNNMRHVYTYDGQERVIKDEYWVDGQLKGETAYTYVDAKQATDTWPVFKGFPVKPVFTGKTGLWATNAYRPKILNGAYYTVASQNQYTQTGAGYVLTSSGTETHTNYDSRNSVYTVKKTNTYSYDGFCD